MNHLKFTEEEIIEKFSETVLRLAASRTEQPSDADDVYQEVFIRYITNPPKFKSEEHAQAWFIKVTINVTKTMYHTAEVKHRADIEDETMDAVFADGGVDFTKQIEDKTDIDAVTKYLKPSYKTVIYLYYNCGYTIKEVSGFLHETEGNVKVLLMRAKRRLRNLLIERDDNNG